MVRYRRNLVPGGTYFFTANLRDRRAGYLVEHIATLRQVFRQVRHQRPFRLDAVVVLPDHLHAVWTLPPGDADYAGRWRAIKSGFSRALSRQGVPLMKNARGEYSLWQRRFWEHTIRDDVDFSQHLAYIHYNPVKHGWAKRPIEWPHSSFHHYVRLGVYLQNWSENPDQSR